MADATAQNGQRYEYQAEVKKLLDILVHSVYSSKDVFIRELVSNAADALEKVRFKQVQGADIREHPDELAIAIETIGGTPPASADDDEDDATPADVEKQFVISDNGIGMTEEEVRDNLGTIAKSGATSFLEKLEENKGDVNLIGQFGIGFYSVFMVASRVVLTTQSADKGAKPVRWESDGLGSYTLSTPEGDVPRGPRIELYLKDDESRFAESYTVQTAIKTYSNFVPFPVKLNGEVKNQTKAIWREQPSQVADEDYEEFFKFLSFDTQEPFDRLHYSADSPLQFSALLYTPRTSPELLGFGEGEVSLHLYVKRVLIDGSNSDLLPKYMRFIKGVVESEDLPLNISRETLQENRIMTKIREILTKKILDRYLELAKNDEAKYLEFWQAFGQFIKEGYTDFMNREKIQKLLRFPTTTVEGLTSLEQYVERMPEAQKAIYYLSGPTKEALAKDARLEIFRKKNVEVLCLFEMADEVVLASLGNFGDKEVVSADQVKIEDLEGLGDDSDDASDEAKTEREKATLPLLERFRSILGARVKDVKLSERLVDSPACLVNPDGQSGHMDKIMRMINRDTELPVRVLEINPKHPLIERLTRLQQANSEDPFVGQVCEQLFDGAMLADGFLKDPHEIVERMHGIMTEAAKMRSTD